MSYYETVFKMPLAEKFSEIDKQVFSNLKHTFTKFSKGDCIICEGDSSTSLCLMVEGSAVITKTEDGTTIRLSKLAAGEIFGEMSFFSRKPRKSNVVANVPSVVLEMDDEFFQKIHPDARDKIKDYLIGLLIGRLDNMNDAIMRISKLMRS
jgi:CRP/FNR family transcriptional regulator, cyclic AMP receptor protein